MSMRSIDDINVFEKKESLLSELKKKVASSKKPKISSPSNENCPFEDKKQ